MTEQREDYLAGREFGFEQRAVRAEAQVRELEERYDRLEAWTNDKDTIYREHRELQAQVRELREALKRRVLDCDHEPGEVCDWCREDRKLLGWPEKPPLVPANEERPEPKNGWIQP